MKREIEKAVDNRAVSPWFRVFGGRGEKPVGDRVRLTPLPCGHRLENVVLSVLIPLVLTVACFDLIQRAAGMLWACVGALPLMFVVIHLLMFVVPFRGPRVQFWGWSLLLWVWAWWTVEQSAWVPILWGARIWWVFMAMQLLATVVLVWRCMMQVSGVPGLVLRSGLSLIVHALMIACWWRYGWQAGVACGVTICGFWSLCVFRPRSSIFGPVMKRVEGKGVLLSIDDGPHPEDTPAILDLLDQHGVKAVFFVVGERVWENPELAREIVARGHELGNHTMTHPQGSMWILGPWRTWREIAGCQKIIEEVTGERPRWFRAPVGHRNYFTHPVTAALGLDVVAWTHRAFDTVTTDVDGIVRRLTRDLKDGDILLMHEATPVSVELAGRVVKECHLSHSE